MGRVRQALRHLERGASMRLMRRSSPQGGPYCSLAPDGYLAEDGSFRDGRLVWGIVYRRDEGLADVVVVAGDLVRKATVAIGEEYSKPRELRR